MVSDEGPSVTVPSGTANPFDIIDNNVVHDEAWLDKDAFPDGLGPHLFLPPSWMQLHWGMHPTILF